MLASSVSVDFNKLSSSNRHCLALKLQQKFVASTNKDGKISQRALKIVGIILRFVKWEYLKSMCNWK